MKQRLRELKHWLKECYYPDNIVSKVFRDAVLQWPATLKNNSKCMLFVTTFYSKTDIKHLVQKFDDVK